MANRGRVFLVCAGLVLATAAAYQPVFKNGFVNFDDDVYVTENSNIKNGFTWQSVSWALTSAHAENWHPLTWLSHILDYKLFGLNPAGHHLTNLMLHIINTLLLFFILQKMTGSTWPSAFVAALFAIHPLHVESVAWIAERKDVLSTLFWLLTILAYWHYTQRPTLLRYSGTLILFSLGLMAKPMLVTLPFVLLLLDYWPLKRAVDSKRTIFKLVLEKLLFIVLAAISSVITYSLQTKTGIDILPLSTRISNAAVSYFSYIGKMIYPAGLAVFYPYPLGGIIAWKITIAAILLVVITITVILARRRYLLVGWLWYLGTLVPIIGLVQVGDQAMADRYTYLPLIGIFIMLAWSAVEIINRIQVRGFVPAIISALIIIALLICTRIQLSYWQNSFTLFERALAVTKNNYKIHYDLGYELISQGDMEEGINHYRRATEIAPENTNIRYNLANALCSQGKNDEAIGEYRKVIGYDKNYADAYNNLGYALLQQGKLDEAATCFRETLKIKPDMVNALVGLSQVLATHPNPNTRDAALAVELSERAAKLTNNHNAKVLGTLAVSYEAVGRFDEAVKTEEAALNLAIAENNTQLVDNTRKLLALFKERKSYQITSSPIAEPSPKPEAKRQWAKPIEAEGLPNCYKVSEDLYRGAQPCDEGMKQLEKLGIKTVVNLREFYSDSNANISDEHISVKPWHPEDEDAVRFLKIVTDKSRTPVFVHCQYGADRTGTMCAIYRIAVQGWSKDEAIEEMTKGNFGFHEIWGNLVEYIRGLDIEKIKQQAGIKQSTTAQ
jgi:protein O-mannosyl-transferase